MSLGQSLLQRDIVMW